MNITPEGKYLIDSYIDEVCFHLPRKKRADIAIEIRSLIYDSLEARSQGSEIIPDEEMVIATLKELGAPLEMASAYHAHNYVIGPQMYAPFVMTVRGVLLFMVFFYVLAFFLSWGEATQSINALLETIWGLVISFIEDALRNFSIIFLVFILLERVIPEQDWVTQLRAWGAVSNIPVFRQIFGRTQSGEWGHPDPKQLPEAKLISRRVTIFGMAVILLVMILLNFFPHKIGIFGIFNGNPWFAPVLAPSLSVYLPWWNLYWLLTLGLCFVLLRNEQWTTLTSWADLGLMVFSGLIVLWMLLGPPVLGVTPEFVDPLRMSTEALTFTTEELIPILAIIFEVILILHLIVKVPVILFKLIKLLQIPNHYTLFSTKRNQS